MSNPLSPYAYRHGLMDGLPIGLGYLSVSFSFGLLAVQKGLAAWGAVLMSLTNVTSAGQLAGLNIIVALGSTIEIILTEIIINLRYALMSISLTQKLDASFTTSGRMLCAFGMTDEIFAVASGKPHIIGRNYFLGLMTLPIIGWTLGTYLGTAAGTLLPVALKNAMGLALYGMFLAIILPPATKNRNVLFVVLGAAALSTLMRYVPGLNRITPGFAVVICAVVAAGLAAALCPVSDTESPDTATDEQEANPS